MLTRDIYSCAQILPRAKKTWLHSHHMHKKTVVSCCLRKGFPCVAKVTSGDFGKLADRCTQLTDVAGEQKGSNRHYRRCRSALPSKYGVFRTSWVGIYKYLIMHALLSAAHNLHALCKYFHSMPLPTGRLAMKRVKLGFSIQDAQYSVRRVSTSTRTMGPARLNTSIPSPGYKSNTSVVSKTISLPWHKQHQPHNPLQLCVAAVRRC